MKKTLKDIMEKQELCNIYTNAGATNKFSAGYIIGVDEEFFLAQSIDPYGKDDGVFCDFIDRIIKIEKDNEYSKNLLILFEHHKQSIYSELFHNHDTVKLAILSYAKTHDKICSFELCESELDDMVGFVGEYNDGVVKIQSVKECGDPDGEAFIVIENISRISCDTQDEKKIEFLYRHKEKNDN